jgi:hypothetical protein
MPQVALILIVLALCGCREEQDRIAATETCTSEAAVLYPTEHVWKGRPAAHIA